MFIKQLILKLSHALKQPMKMVDSYNISGILSHWKLNSHWTKTDKVASSMSDFKIPKSNMGWKIAVPSEHIKIPFYILVDNLLYFWILLGPLALMPSPRSGKNADNFLTHARSGTNARHPSGKSKNKPNYILAINIYSLNSAVENGCLKMLPNKVQPDLSIVGLLFQS